MIFYGYDRNGQTICRVLFDYLRNTGVHNGILLYRFKQAHPVAAVTSVPGDKEAILKEWNASECIDESTVTSIHHWKIEQA